MLDAKIINSFLQGVNSICVSLFGASIKIGKIYVKDLENETCDVLILVGVTGSYKGQSVISMEIATAKELAKRMMSNFDMPQSVELDDISKSALSELSNMIMGRASLFMAKNGFNVDITPPTLLSGHQLQLTNSKDCQNICVPLEIDGFPLEFTVFLKENSKQ